LNNKGKDIFSSFLVPIYGKEGIRRKEGEEKRRERTEKKKKKNKKEFSWVDK